MKVHNYTTSYLAVLLLLIIAVWAAVFYYAMLDEIYDSIDDGLDNQKGLILQKVVVDSTILQKKGFDEGGFNIREVPPSLASNFRDVYIDTTMFMQNEQDFEPVRLLRTVFRHRDRYYQLEVFTSMVGEDDLVSELFYALLWLYFGLIATFLVVNNLVLKRIWRPFYYLIKQLKNFKLESPSIKVKKTTIDEFSLLNDAVQNMVQSNIDSYTSQKQFIENASHELQTPLAISVAKLEALAETGSLTAEQSQLLSSAINNLERLTRLNRSLLLLSKIENRQFASVESVNINDLLKKIADDFSDQLSYRQLTLNIKEEDIAIVQMNTDLATILVTNLVKNAIVHNIPGGTIDITIRKDGFVVANTGQNKPLNEQVIFTRFYKEKQALTSTGLGLAVAKAIARLFGFRLSYTFNGKHNFGLSFQQ